MYITKIHLKNIRAIKDLTLPMHDGPLEMQTLVIGANSTNKSTILRAIAMGLCTETDAGALLAELSGAFVGTHGNESIIEISLRPSKVSSKETTITTIIRPEFEDRMTRKRQVEDRVDQEVEAERPIFQKQNSKGSVARKELFVCGYGAGRSVLGTESFTRYRLIDSVYTLFRYDQPLQNAELILLRLRRFYPKIYPVTMNRIREILRLNSSHKFRLEKSGVMISGPSIGKRIPLHAVADGYRATFLWLCDLIGWAMMANRIDRLTGDITGVVLIDEVEQHIHPSWQAEMISFIRRIFPKLQIIGTTHSPLVALGVDPLSLIALKRKGLNVYAEENVPDYSNYSAEDLLTDPELFNTKAFSPEVNRKMVRYHSLVGIPKQRRTARQKVELKNLANALQGHIPSSADDALAKELRRLSQKYDL